jgi:AraC-like DNA-binding protein
MRATIYPNPDLVIRIMQAKRYIDCHYASDINLDRMAREAWMSKFHFIRLFRKYYGRTPHVYLKEVRLVQAKYLLRSGMPVKDVCLAVGFESVPSFTRLYKTMNGRSPKKAILDKKVSG